jgi:hypothetical protein
MLPQLIANACLDSSFSLPKKHDVGSSLGPLMINSAGLAIF